MNTSVVKKQSALLLNDLKKHADHYCRHEFNILGSGWRNVAYGIKTDGFEGKNFSIEFGYEDFLKEIPEQFIAEHHRLMSLGRDFSENYSPIDWQIDFRSGFRFRVDTHHSRLKYGVTEGVDAKISADLGRGYQFVVLAKMYCAGGEKKYRNECIAQMLDWVASNPYEYGAGWRACMNVAIRAANLVVATDLLGLAGQEEIFNVMKNSFIQHGGFIINNLEYPQQNFHPNHFIANLGGLLVLAAYIKNWHEEAAAWHDFALETISKEILNQTLPDGANYEGATSYHGLVLEMLACALLFAARVNGAKKPGSVREWLGISIGRTAALRLKKMFYVLRDISQPDGRIPLIGDSDSGRFLQLEGGARAPSRDWRFLLMLGSTLYDDPLLCPGNSYDSQTTRMLLDVNGTKRRNAVQYPPSNAYRDVGFYIMRHNNSYIFINCGPVGTDGKGGHAHNDKLALTLMIDGLDIFVDPGIYTYTASGYFRNLYRSVKSHNTLSVSGEEQNRWGRENPWWGVIEETKCKCLKWENTESRDVFIGRHYAYQRLEEGAVHQRTVKWEKTVDEISILDELLDIKGQVPVAECGFMLHNDCVITCCGEKEIHLRNRHLKVKITSDEGCWETQPAFYSPEYGVKKYVQKLVLKLPRCSRNNITIRYFLTEKN